MFSRNIKRDTLKGFLDKMTNIYQIMVAPGEPGSKYFVIHNLTTESLTIRDIGHLNILKLLENVNFVWLSIPENTYGTKLNSLYSRAAYITSSCEIPPEYMHKCIITGDVEHENKLVTYQPGMDLSGIKNIKFAGDNIPDNVADYEFYYVEVQDPVADLTNINTEILRTIGSTTGEHEIPVSDIPNCDAILATTCTKYLDISGRYFYFNYGMPTYMPYDHILGFRCVASLPPLGTKKACERNKSKMRFARVKPICHGGDI